jgi:hypothetical protein
MESNFMSKVVAISNVFKLFILFLILFTTIYFSEGWTFLYINEKNGDFVIECILILLIVLIAVGFGWAIYIANKEHKKFIAEIEKEYFEKKSKIKRQEIDKELVFIFRQYD